MAEVFVIMLVIVVVPLLKRENVRDIPVFSTGNGGGLHAC
jgi:hypothetical protein